mmetsp:Transcript_90519/g.180671  ORF Transcript_90519/g.180671 Transcript_90519/m.180671 type:complete len:164 (+) Transcript_90519:351-842(+)
MEHSLVAAIKARAREDLAQRLLHTEGFTMLGSFEDWQGLGGEAVAVRRHLHLPRPLLFCTLPLVADHSCRQLLRRASGVSDWRHDENDDAHWSEGSGTHIAGSHHHHAHGLMQGVSAQHSSSKDWGDVAAVFSTHTKPSFFKAAFVRNPVSRLLAVMRERVVC